MYRSAQHSLSETVPWASTRGQRLLITTYPRTTSTMTSPCNNSNPQARSAAPVPPFACMIYMPVMELHSGARSWAPCRWLVRGHSQHGGGSSKCPRPHRSNPDTVPHTVSYNLRGHHIRADVQTHPRYRASGSHRLGVEQCEQLHVEELTRGHGFSTALAAGYCEQREHWQPYNTLCTTTRQAT
jgi:hypothetical protein